LNLSWHETEKFLSERQGFLDYTEEDLRQDTETLNEILEK
jgi:predicted HTH domain antitoxin